MFFGRLFLSIILPFCLALGWLTLGKNSHPPRTYALPIIIANTPSALTFKYVAKFQNARVRRNIFYRREFCGKIQSRARRQAFATLRAEIFSRPQPETDWMRLLNSRCT